MRIKTLAIGGLVLVASIVTTGCKVPQKVAYFQDATDIVEMAKATPIMVRPDDKLNILVKSKDAAVSDLFNLGIYSTRYGQTGSVSGTGGTLRQYAPGANDGVANYTVDPEGYIDFPILGKLKVAGMTRSELAGFIKGELMARDLVKDPTVSVEFVNTGINMLGEVYRPGRYDLNVNNLNILEAISLAGDISINGRRDNVKVLREENGQMHVYTLDLTKLKDIAKSPGYNLQQDDIIYVEPTDMRKRQTTVNGNNALSTSFWISVASLITTAVTTVGVFVNK